MRKCRRLFVYFLNFLIISADDDPHIFSVAIFLLSIRFVDGWTNGIERKRDRSKPIWFVWAGSILLDWTIKIEERSPLLPVSSWHFPPQLLLAAHIRPASWHFHYANAIDPLISLCGGEKEEELRSPWNPQRRKWQPEICFDGASNVLIMGNQQHTPGISKA